VLSGNSGYSQVLHELVLQGTGCRVNMTNSLNSDHNRFMG